MKTENPIAKLPADVIEAFEELGHAQRGEPEEVMRKIQHLHSGVLSHAVEHVGDLTHRMSHGVSFIGLGQGYIRDKTKIGLSELKRGVGWMPFLTEHAQNLEGNVRYWIEHNYKDKPQTVEELEAELAKLLTKYSEEHAKLTVYNKPQWLAREAAVALGKLDIPKAVEYLEQLHYFAHLSEEEWNRVAGAVERDSEGKIIPYMPKKKENPMRRNPYVRSNPVRKLMPKTADSEKKFKEEARRVANEKKTLDFFDVAYDNELEKIGLSLGLSIAEREPLVRTVLYTMKLENYVLANSDWEKLYKKSGLTLRKFVEKNEEALGGDYSGMRRRLRTRNPMTLSASGTDDRPDARYDPMELYKGVHAELKDKHSPRIDISKKIAKDHLDENKKYYSMLEAVEKPYFPEATKTKSFYQKGIPEFKNNPVVELPSAFQTVTNEIVKILKMYRDAARKERVFTLISLKFPELSEANFDVILSELNKEGCLIQFIREGEKEQRLQLTQKGLTSKYEKKKFPKKQLKAKDDADNNPSRKEKMPGKMMVHVYLSREPDEVIPSGEMMHPEVRARPQTQMAANPSDIHDIEEYPDPMTAEGERKHPKNALKTEGKKRHVYKVEPFPNYLELVEEHEPVKVEGEKSSNPKRKTMKLQTLIFDKKQFTKAKVKAWCEKHNVRRRAIDETDNSYRVRQIDPDEMKPKSMRTITFKKGVKAVVGKLK